MHDLYADQIGRYCRRRLRSREDAEDATQIVFLTAQRCLANGVEPRSERAWLFKIAEHVVLGQWRALRQRARLASPVDIDQLADSAVAAGSGLLPEIVDLQAALARVPAAQRRALVLREWRGLSYAEVAEELGVTAATVETLILQARGSLAQQLGETSRRSRKSRLLGLLPSPISAQWIFGGGAAVKAVAGAASLAVVTVGVLAPHPQPSAADPLTREPAAAVSVAAAPRSRHAVHAPLGHRLARSVAVPVVRPATAGVPRAALPPEAAPAAPEPSPSAAPGPAQLPAPASDAPVPAAADGPASATGDASLASAPAWGRGRAEPPATPAVPRALLAE
ncbi:MAG: RNA polymerase sigma factor, partial [Gaiellaceae bacterium]